MAKDSIPTWVWILAGLIILGTGGAVVYTQTRGLRNNNPGHIRDNIDNDWNGQTGTDDAGFVIFDTMQNGIRALTKILKNYGLNTITQIISRWAPPSENDTAAYISSVANSTGFDPNQALNMNDANTLTALVAAITRQENGLMPLDVATIQQGVMSA